MKCPFCGAAASSYYGFLCGSGPNHGQRSAACREREIGALKARIARLEAAGDSLKEEARPTMFDTDETRKRIMDTIDAWDAAREVQP